MYDDELDEERREPPHWNIGLEGRTWNVDHFLSLDGVLPEKMELIDGKLFWSQRERLAMLSAMLEQVGLREAVKLAPKELWLEALREAAE